MVGGTCVKEPMLFDILVDITGRSFSGDKETPPSTSPPLSGLPVDPEVAESYFDLKWEATFSCCIRGVAEEMCRR